MMRTRSSISLFSSSLLPTILILICLFNGVASRGSREALEIVIGGGTPTAPAPSPENEDCNPPPPPEPECPPPPPPPSPPPPPPSPPPPSPPPPSPPPPSPPPPRPPPPPPPSPPPPSPPPPRPPPPPPPSPPPPSPPPPRPPPPPPPSPPPPRPPPPPPPPPISKRVVKAAKAILDFKKTIKHGPPEVLASWNGLDACKYKGITCDNIPDFDNERAVAGIDFNGYGFEGNGGQLKLEGFIERLEDLAFFHANSNNFTGTVSDISIQKIRFLYEFDLSNNKLSGEFPYKVLAAKNLTFLDLRFNQFYGNVPNEIFTLDVQVIFINNNNFRQNLPNNLGKTPALYLTFANNEFTGQIPGSIGLASETLIEVLFLNNKLSGCLPYEIGLLKKTTLFDASKNKITGPIPQSFACLRRIEILNLASNHLYGEVPELVCKLPNLQTLSLSDNYFTQVGTLCRKLIMKKRLDVRNNCIFDLPNQRPKEECERFFTKNPKTCSKNKMMYYIPCTRQWAYQGSDGRQLFASYDDGDDHDHDHDSGRRSSSPVLYGALTPNGLRI